MGTAGHDGGSAFSAVPADIASAARTLREVASRSAAARTFSDAGDVGEYGDISAAVSGMVAGWRAALDRWERSVTALGEATAHAGAAIGRVDAESAAMWTSPRFVPDGVHR